MSKFVRALVVALLSASVVMAAAPAEAGPDRAQQLRRDGTGCC